LGFLRFTFPCRVGWSVIFTWVDREGTICGLRLSPVGCREGSLSLMSAFLCWFGSWWNGFAVALIGGSFFTFGWLDLPPFSGCVVLLGVALALDWGQILEDFLRLLGGFSLFLRWTVHTVDDSCGREPLRFTDPPAKKKGCVIFTVVVAFFDRVVSPCSLSSTLCCSAISRIRGALARETLVVWSSLSH
jgi:hypothetical protein